MNIILEGNITSVSPGTTAQQLVQDNTGRIVGAYINGKIASLASVLNEGDQVEFIPLSITDGQRIFKRSVLFMLYAAFHELYPEYTLECAHSIYRGEYVEVYPAAPKQEELDRVLSLMQTWVTEDQPIMRLTANEKNIQEVISQRWQDITRTMGHYLIYQLKDYADFSINTLVPSCGFLYLFDVRLEDMGLLVSFPSKSALDSLELPKKYSSLAKTFKTMDSWSKIHGIHYLGDLNQKVAEGNYHDMISVCEILQENSFADAAARAIERNAKAVLLTGPSSSGKTTSAYRLRIQFMVQGMFPMVISMDDYFKDRKDILPGPDGTVDYESIDCEDLEDFAAQMYALIRGEGVKKRHFDFISGSPWYEEEETFLPENGILIIEGIHAFNPIVLDLLKDLTVFKLAVNALTLINVDHHNRMSSSDIRKLRRIVRDIRTRGYSAEHTLAGWKSVRAGEEKNIFPYLEDCDAMINTTLVYEASALKKQAAAALEAVDRNSPVMPEVHRLTDILAKVKGLPDNKDIPANSLIREFIG